VSTYVLNKSTFLLGRRGWVNYHYMQSYLELREAFAENICKIHFILYQFNYYENRVFIQKIVQNHIHKTIFHTKPF